MKSIIKPLRNIGFTTIALTLALVANFAYGQWANPTVAPTGGNVSLPVTTSNVTQTKQGNFGAVSVFSAATSSAAIAMESPLYCDENGANCWDPSVGTPPSTGGGAGILAYMRNQGFNFPAPPPNLSEWPDWVYCGRGIMPFRSASAGGVNYGVWPIGDNYVGGLSYNASGNQTFNNVGSCGASTIQAACQQGRCGFNNGGAPVIDGSLICNAYGCSANGACSGGGCPAPGETCNQYGCSSGGACTAYGCP